MEAGIEFVAVDAPYANKLMLHILSAVAEHERELISQRTKAALAAAKQRGVKLGTYGTTLAAAQKERAQAFAEKLRPVMVEILETGPSTLANIVKILTDRGIQTRESGHWSPMMVSRVLSRLQLSHCDQRRSLDHPNQK
jgi:DNA invertase Pin-like site-specific DNA recombinase